MWKNTPECSHLGEPDFNVNPWAWFDWFDNCMSGSGAPTTINQPPIPCHPKRVTFNGQCYEIVCTPDGPDIRPCFKFPIPVIHPASIISLRITTDGFMIQTQSEHGITADKIEHGKIRLSELGHALLHKTALPSADIKHIKPEFWKEQKK